jgi:succinyl-CoA--D-citramalate CoA-transferase
MKEKTRPLHGNRGPLKGIRVLEVGSFIAGPFCAQILADFGAQVIKVEPPVTGDPMRQWGQAKFKGQSLWWPVLSRNKRSIVLNLRMPEGQELLGKLIAKCDVMIENFRPGTLEKWGLPPERIEQINPRLVVVRISGYGQTGPYRDRAGFGSVAEAMGGIRGLTGYPDRPTTRVGISLGDNLASTFGALGAVMALYYRDGVGTGKGQVIDVGIYEAVLNFVESLISEYDKTGYIRKPSGPTLPGVAPSNIYPTKDGTPLIIGANADTVFRRLADAMGRPELADDERFATHTARGKNMKILDEIISEWTASWDWIPLLDHINKAGIPAGPIYTPKEMLEDPHFAARENIVEVEVPGIGPLKMQGICPKLSLTPGAVHRAGPELGEHNREIYGELLGLSEAEMDVLAERGVIR